MRKTIVLVASAALLLMLLFGSLLSVSFYRRWKAGELLNVVRQLRPGTTTEVQARALLKPFARFGVGAGQEHDARNLVQFDFVNSPKWHPLARLLPWTLFTVNIEFVNGLIARIDVIEMQVDHPGYPHPNSASVSIRSSKLSPLPLDENGYHEYSQSTGEVDSQGKWTGFKCCHERFIKLDERATPSQLSQSFNFKLSCMTSFVRCKDDRQLLP